MFSSESNGLIVTTSSSEVAHWIRSRTFCGYESGRFCPIQSGWFCPRSLAEFRGRSRKKVRERRFFCSVGPPISTNTSSSYVERMFYAPYIPGKRTKFQIVKEAVFGDNTLNRISPKRIMTYHPSLSTGYKFVTKISFSNGPVSSVQKCNLSASCSRRLQFCSC